MLRIWGEPEGVVLFSFTPSFFLGVLGGSVSTQQLHRLSRDEFSLY
jgi:hypothetical protein